MAQTAWAILLSEAGTVIFEKVIDNLDALVSCYSGSSPPTSPTPVAGQLFFKTTTKELHQYDGSSWVVIASALAGSAPDMDARASEPSITASATIPLDVLDANATAVSLVVLTDTTTTSNATDHWTIQVRNATAGNDLRSAAFDTNGSDFTAWTAKTITLDQNLSLSSGAALRVALTKNASATNLGYTLFILRMVPR